MEYWIDSPVDVVVVLIVASQSDKGTDSQTIREEYLSDTFSCTGESNSTNEQHRYKKVREEGRKINHLKNQYSQDTLRLLCKKQKGKSKWDIQ